MKCPFRYKWRQNFSFGVDGEFLDWCNERDAKAEKAFNEKYPTCWKKFLHWLTT
jgi:hypothetical protein